jgi:hypothetical protein
MHKVKVRWQGFTGSPGWSNFYFDDATGDLLSNADAIAVADRVKTFFTNIKGMFPNVVNWKIQSDVEVIAESTGELIGVEAIPDIPAIVGTGGATGYSAATGFVVTWRTAGVRTGRRVRGRTFLVPAASISYGTDGTIETVTLGTLTAQAALLANTAGTIPLGVWSRPTAPGAADGAWYPVNAATVPDMAAVLRSRRD